MSNYAIGIDLGTTYSCVGVVKDGQVKIIHNDCGSKTTASCVAFTDHERLIGDSAKAQGVKNFQNTIFDVKRLIGRKYSESVIENDSRHYPFKIVDQNGRCGAQVQFKKVTTTFTPEELSAMILTKMKQTAETFLRQSVKDAVITVPAYFSNSQRQATKDAAAIAGLNVLRIINEPTAAGIAYALDEKTPNKQNILIYDLGGGTFDVTVMTIENKDFTVRSTSGDTHLGGEDFDSCLVDYCVADIKQNTKIDLAKNKRALQRLRKACEAAKRILSYQTQTTIEVDGLIDGDDFSLDIGRSRFEELCLPLFKKTLESMDKAIADADKIDEVILVGGSTRIPIVQRLLREYFQGKELNNTVHPDEAVAYGAAVQAAILVGSQEQLVRSVRIRDVVPISLGVAASSKFSVVIKKNTPIPATCTEVMVTANDYQKEVAVRVFEGENDECDDNNFLGEFILRNIRQAPKGEVEFDVVFKIDANGILEVQETERGTKNTGSILIDSNTGCLAGEMISVMTKLEEIYVAHDRALMGLVDGIENI